MSAAGIRFLILGGTAWLGGHVTSTALALGHQVTCLARGSSGAAPVGAAFVHVVVGTRLRAVGVAGDQWDVVIDVSRQPGQVKSAVAALADRTGFFVFVSSGTPAPVDPCQRTANEHLVVAQPVEVGSVDQTDALVDGGPDCRSCNLVIVASTSKP
jgi:nucleoside-diphosphate-sugar epimerase